jgi:hypothetical protein
MRNKSQQGLSMLETMLALAIMMAALTLGLKQYRQFQRQQDLSKILYNVDVLFQGLGSFYQAYCGTATLAPTVPSPYAVTISGAAPDLVNSKFISKWPLQSVAGVVGYVTQFNLSPASTMNTRVCWNFGKTNTTLHCEDPQPLQTGTNTVYVWTAQVAVQLSASFDAATYRGLLGADCRSNLSGSTVTPCVVGSYGSSGQYLVWQRLPSLASPNMTSALWISTPRVKQFNLQYTHDQMYEMQKGVTVQNYLCGG